MFLPATCAAYRDGNVVGAEMRWLLAMQARDRMREADRRYRRKLMSDIDQLKVRMLVICLRAVGVLLNASIWVDSHAVHLGVRMLMSGCFAIYVF